MKTARLFVVATPIGNLEDITFRAVRVLREADLIAAEDTRRTRKLLSYYQIRKPVVSYHKFNSRVRAPDLIAALEEGKQVALVTDAGTPGVSDPGSYLVREAARRGISMEAIPGPSAVTAALSVAGLDADTFHFFGFPPARKGERRRFLEAIRSEEDTLVFFESAKRIAGFLADLAEILGSRQAVVGRELTKLHGEYLRGSLEELAARFQGKVPQGEITLVVEGYTDEGCDEGEREIDGDIRRLKEAGFRKEEILEVVSGWRNLPKRVVYREMLRQSADPVKRRDQRDGEKKPAGE